MEDRAELTAEERAELERLRVEVATLRVQRTTSAADRPMASEGWAARRRWRTIVASLLVVLGCVLAPLAGVAVWARNQVTDTDQYVRTVEPLARDPVIQQAVADRITALVFAYLDIQGLTTQAVDALADRGLPSRLADPLRALTGPIAGGVRGYARSQVGEVVASPVFADAWVQANRVAHAELVRALTGEGGGAVTVEDDTVSVNLAAFVQVVRERLVASGFTLAARIPEVNASFVLFQSPEVARARWAFRLLNTLGTWLPVIVLVLLALGVFVAHDHRRALVGAAMGVAVAMVVLALGLAVFRAVYLDAMPSQVLPGDAAAVLYDTMVRFLRAGLRTVLVLALVVAGGAFLTGPSSTAVRTRQGLAQAIRWLRGGADRAGFRTGSVGAWVHATKPVLQFGAVALALLVLVFWGQLTGKVVLLLAALLLAALGVIEFLGQPPPRPAPTIPQRGPGGQPVP